MIALQLLSTVLAMALDRLVQTRGGTMGLVALFLVAAGIRARNATCASIGAILFVLLMTQA